MNFYIDSKYGYGFDVISNWVSHKRGHCPWTILSTISEDYRHAVERHKLFLIESDVASDASSKEGRKR